VFCLFPTGWVFQDPSAAWEDPANPGRFMFIGAKKRMFLCHIYTETDHFTKTGSRQKLGKESQKQTLFLRCRHDLPFAAIARYRRRRRTAAAVW
jgi:hypothetical protein